jgi:hypothetical protein
MNIKVFRNCSARFEKDSEIWLCAGRKVGFANLRPVHNQISESFSKRAEQLLNNYANIGVDLCSMLK